MMFDCYWCLKVKQTSRPEYCLLVDVKGLRRCKVYCNEMNVGLNTMNVPRNETNGGRNTRNVLHNETNVGRNARKVNIVLWMA